jgi:predicted DNA-binding transcriptional regulator AlpA
MSNLSEIISPKDLPKETGISRVTVWRLEKAGDFPPRIQLSPGRVGYRRADVTAWLESRKSVVFQ